MVKKLEIRIFCPSSNEKKKVLSDSKQEDKCDIYMVLITTVLIFISHVDGSMKFGDTEGPLSLHVRVCMCFVCVYH